MPQIPVLATVNGDHFLIDDYINDVVDIWSLSTYVGMPEKVDYFQQRRHEGDRICPYIHSWAMLNNSALKLREFFWDLWRYRADGCTLWCVNGWYFEPEVSAYFKRFENMKKREDGGFDVLLQNLDLGAADCLFWPGKDQILDSIRLELIRDGIEDFECLRMAEERVSDKTIPGALRNRIRKTIDRYRNEFGEVGRNEETLSAARRELGELLSQSEAFAARERKGR